MRKMNSHGRGILTIISGFSGAGKGTVVRELLLAYPEKYRLSISATTRKPREGEVEGQHYFYKTKEEFEKMIAGGQMLEYANYVGNYYGTPRQYVEEQLEAGYDVILEIEQQGAIHVKRAMPEAVLIFLTPPTIEELESRLRGRHTETEEVIMSRMSQAAIEAEKIGSYDYIVINDDVEGCVASLNRLIQGEHQRIRYNDRKIRELQKDLQPYKR
jgi:guanylate kinase